MSARRRFQLAGLVRYCGERMGREQGIAIDAWTVRLEAEPAGWQARVAAHVAGMRVEAVGHAMQPDAAIWEAMCRIEQPLRETRHTPQAA